MKTIKELDILRVLSIYWIAGFSHLSSYLEYKEAMQAAELYDITRAALASMMFLSGFLLSKYSYREKREVIEFYKRRFKRFFILYAIAAITLLMLGFNSSYKVLITTLLCLSSYILPQPSTLWFMSMLASFYILTPTIGKIYSKNKQYAYLVCIALVLLTFFYRDVVDARLYWCLFFYVAGYFVGRLKKYENSKFLNRTGGLIICLWCSLIINRMTGEKVYNTDLILGIASILWFSNLIRKIANGKMVTILSYTSMCLFLYHRHVYILCRHFWIHYIDNVHRCSTAYGFLVMLPMAIIIAYTIQRGYDVILASMEKKC